MSKSPLYVPCPNCKTDVLWDEKSPFRPFCSKRCQLIDLGEWADENHRISGTELSVEGLSVEDLESIIDLDNHPYQD